MPKSGKVLIFIALLKRHISITTTYSGLSHVPRGLMVIIQFIMGFIMGIYLMEILDGQWATKKVLTFSKTDSSIRMGEKRTIKRIILEILR